MCRTARALLGSLAIALGAGVTAPPALAGSDVADGALRRAPGATPFAHTRIVDLTHDFAADTIFWPTEKPFSLEVEFAGETPGGWYYAANRFDTAEHGGTHLDAPIHFAAHGETADRIPVERFLGPAAVVDVRPAATADADLLVGVGDLLRWEARNGRIPDGALVLVRTGWSDRWGDRARYLGTDRTGADAVKDLHFPGIAPEAARWLVDERRVAAVGIDTASIDRGQSTDFQTHRILLGAGIPAFENVANLGELPESGSFVIALPMKIRGGSGGPARIIALVPAP